MPAATRFGDPKAAILTGASGQEGRKVKGGVIALDGSNPTPLATGLTTIDSLQLTLRRATALSAGTAFVTHDTPVGGNVDLYGWLQTGLASTGTETVAWLAIGT